MEDYIVKGAFAGPVESIRSKWASTVEQGDVYRKMQRSEEKLLLLIFVIQVTPQISHNIVLIYYFQTSSN